MPDASTRATSEASAEAADGGIVEPYAAVVGVTCGSEVVGVVAAAIGTADGRAGDRADVRQAAAVARRSRRAIRGAWRNGLVVPVGLVVQLVGLPEGARDRAKAPVVRRADAEFMLLVLVFLGRMPERAGREAG